MRTTAIMNLKGGTAKTVTAINLAAIYARDYAERVLLVDADSQANLTEFMCLRMPDGSASGGFADLLRGLRAGPISTKLDNVSILWADETLMALDVTAAGSGAADPMALAAYLDRKDVREIYDRVIIDCPPAFSAGAMAALIAADEVVIPTKIDAFGIRGIPNLLEQIRNMKRINPDLEVAGVLPTMFYPTQEQRDAEAALRKSLLTGYIPCFRHIRRSTKVDDSTFAQEALIYSSPKSGACRDYKIFAKELAEWARDPDPYWPGIATGTEGGEM